VNPVVFLDSGPLGLVVHPKANKSRPCVEWLLACLRAGTRICLPEIADYEVRRELLRQDSAKSLAKLDQLKDRIEYIPLSTSAMRQAAALWAQARKDGKPTADPHALDGDVILCAQARLAVAHPDDLIIATSNVGHLSRFVSTKHWSEISP
jgi:predicted nucleic acid-binding protein